MSFRFSKTLTLVLVVALVAFTVTTGASAVSVESQTRAIDDLRYVYGNAGLMLYYTPVDDRSVYEPLVFYEAGNLTLSQKTGLFNPSKPNVYSFMASRSAFELYFQNAVADDQGFFLTAVPIQYMYSDSQPSTWPQYEAYIYNTSDTLSGFPANRVGATLLPGVFGFDSISVIADLLESWGFWSVGQYGGLFEYGQRPANFVYISLDDLGLSVTLDQLMRYEPGDVPKPSDFSQDLDGVLSDDNDGGFIQLVLDWIYDKFPFIIPLMLGLIAAGLIIMLI